jgi:hypothetical protein
MLQCVWQVVFLLKKIIIIIIIIRVLFLCWKDYLTHTYVRPKIWKHFGIYIIEIGIETTISILEFCSYEIGFWHGLMVMFNTSTTSH